MAIEAYSGHWVLRECKLLDRHLLYSFIDQYKIDDQIDVWAVDPSQLPTISKTLNVLSKGMFLFGSGAYLLAMGLSGHTYRYREALTKQNLYLRIIGVALLVFAGWFFVRNSKTSSVLYSQLETDLSWDGNQRHVTLQEFAELRAELLLARPVEAKAAFKLPEDSLFGAPYLTPGEKADIFQERMQMWIEALEQVWPFCKREVQDGLNKADYVERAQQFLLQNPNPLGPRVRAVFHSELRTTLPTLIQNLRQSSSVENIEAVMQELKNFYPASFDV
jgi:hypothetical protein